MIDSDKHAYASDENGEILSLQEMRNKIINGESIIFNSFTKDPIPSQTRLYFYWAKNLYYLDAVEKQTYAVENSGTFGKIYLVPDYNNLPKCFIPNAMFLQLMLNDFGKNQPLLSREIC